VKDKNDMTELENASCNLKRCTYWVTRFYHSPNTRMAK